uniref:CSON005711 protein n=1 Tax=Culicoides sonorensis TaxID=179676 RepID=A0A336MTZ3_CULSO
MENDYLIETGRKKKKGGNSNTNNIEIVSGGGDHGGYEHGDDVSYEMVHFKQKGKKQKMKKGKKRKGYTKYVKSMTPIGLCILALKMLLQHFFIKKLAVFALGSFLLSKTSFILSTLLALKQLFHSNGHEKSDSGGKLEVVHIPIRKKHPDFHDRDNVETIKYIPITYPADIYDQTTPHFIDYQYPNYENLGTFTITYSVSCNQFENPRLSEIRDRKQNFTQNMEQQFYASRYYQISNLIHSSTSNDISISVVKSNDITIVNVYKPPNIQWPENVTNVYEHPSVYCEDFNSHAVDWGYVDDDYNG